ncbi:hypothetical protein ACHHYP_07384 [Achlya hypogyna]|uniref:Uncharacterized protein n=1 Tax=Achlya hypogyna TaxID=1202772 RepID=A0A1V9ZM83_ACHHY|nr:hypothetical protein ACHHYP_07384 [Achlya hypogyna]
MERWRMEPWKPERALRARKDRVAPVADGDAIVHDVLERWVAQLPADARSSENRTEALGARLLQHASGQWHEEADGDELSPRVATALAMDVVTTMLRRTLPASPIADAVAQTLLQAVYRDYDPRKDLIDNQLHLEGTGSSKETRRSHTALEATPDEAPIESATERIPPAKVDYDAMSALWNDLVQQREDVAEGGVVCLVECIQTLPVAAQLQVIEHVSSSLRQSDQDPRTPAAANPDTDERIPCDDDDFDDDWNDDPGDSHLSVLDDLREIYRLLFIPDTRAQRSARYKLQVLLAGTFGDAPVDPGDAARRLAQSLQGVDRLTRARELLL